jgi:hypothetical protein
VINPFIAKYLQGYKLIGVGDPAGNRRSETDFSTAIGVLNEKGIPTEGASTNIITKRLKAVDMLLNRLTDGMPALVVSRKGCPMVRKGFQEKYCWKVVAGEKEPDKNEYSHPMDATQYISLLATGDLVVKPSHNPTLLPGGLC